MIRKLKYLFSLSILSLTTHAFADMTVAMYETADQGHGKAVGNIIISENKYGLLFSPNLHSLSPGIHGFHIHLNPSCEKDGMEAGGHLDPKETKKHLGPYNDEGHLGDLPALTVNADGTSVLPVLAPRFKSLDDLKHHSLMIHDGGDNYSDKPEKSGGGGDRMICGVM